MAATRHEIFQFVSEAHFEDGGEAACHAVFDLSLGDLVMDFLGDGTWLPEPKRWPNNKGVVNGIRFKRSVIEGV